MAESRLVVTEMLDNGFVEESADGGKAEEMPGG